MKYMGKNLPELDALKRAIEGLPEKYDSTAYAKEFDRVIKDGDVLTHTTFWDNVTRDLLQSTRYLPVDEVKEFLEADLEIAEQLRTSIMKLRFIAGTTASEKLANSEAAVMRMVQKALFANLRALIIMVKNSTLKVDGARNLDIHNENFIM